MKQELLKGLSEEQIDKRVFYKCKKCGEMWRR